MALRHVRNPGVGKPDGLKPLSAEIAAALARSLAALPDSVRDDRLFLRPAQWRNDGVSYGVSYEAGSFEVYCRGKRVGYVLQSTWYGTRERPWVWGIDGTKMLGLTAASREEAMTAFRKASDARPQTRREA
jgi:hypothetical protein